MFIVGIYQIPYTPTLHFSSLDCDSFRQVIHYTTRLLMSVNECLELLPIWTHILRA